MSIVSVSGKVMETKELTTKTDGKKVLQVLLYQEGQRNLINCRFPIEEKDDLMLGEEITIKQARIVSYKSFDGGIDLMFTKLA